MVEVEVGCARGCEREVFGNMWVAIGIGTVAARARSGNVEAGLACVAIEFARGEWVLVEVGGSKFSFSFSLLPLKHKLILFSVLLWWRLRLVVRGVARGKFSAICGLRSALERSRRELISAMWRLGWLVLQSGLLEVSGFWLK